MLRQSFVTLCLLSVTLASDMKHPVREEIVQDIKLKATSWKPKEVHENHLRHVPADKIQGRFGQLGNTPFSKGAEVMTNISKGAKSVFDQITAAMGLKAGAFEHHLQKASSDAKEEEKEEDIPDADEFGMFSGVPASFSWREAYPECLGPIED